jgi:hypothetical protein
MVINSLKVVRERLDRALGRHAMQRIKVFAVLLTLVAMVLTTASVTAQAKAQVVAV